MIKSSQKSVWITEWSSIQNLTQNQPENGFKRHVDQSMSLQNIYFTIFQSSTAILAHNAVKNTAKNENKNKPLKTQFLTALLKTLWFIQKTLIKRYIT